MSHVLTPEEMQALREAVRNGSLECAPKAPVATRKVTPYDFLRPCVFSDASFRRFQLTHEAFAKRLQAALTPLWKTPVEVRVSPAEQTIFRDFLRHASPPTLLLRLEATPGPATVLADWSLPLPLALANRLFGGDGSVPDPIRELTELEQNILYPLIDSMLAELKEAWRSVGELTLTRSQWAYHPDHIQVTGLETPCLSTTLELALGSLTGTLRLCYPLAVFPEAASRRPIGAARGAVDDRTSWASPMRRALEIAPLPVRVVLGTLRIRARDLAGLRPGDVLGMEYRLDRPARVLIGDTELFQARLGQSRGRWAARLIAFDLASGRQADAGRARFSDKSQPGGVPS